MTQKHPLTFRAYALSCIEELQSSGRYGTAGTYRNALNSLTAYLRSTGRSDIPVRDITPALIESYNESLRSRRMLRNSVSFYNRTIRAIYHRAVASLGIKNLHPFAGVYTGTDKTSNRAASEEEIWRIMNSDTGGDTELSLTKDLFTFSYLCRGMTFIDMAYLKKNDMEGDYIIYRRKKTNALLKVRLEPRARAIIDRWRDRCGRTVYLFPILGSCDRDDAYRRYRSSLTIYNRNLKLLAEMAKVTTHLTSYVSRHSWASSAYRSGVAMNMIGESLGHTSERTTRIYVSSINQDRLDQINRSVVERIKKFDSSLEPNSSQRYKNNVTNQIFFVHTEGGCPIFFCLYD